MTTLVGKGCSQRPTGSLEPVALSGPTMGTRWSVKVSQLPAGITADELQAEIETRLERINDLMSTYRADSELSRFNRAAADEWFNLSPETATVIKAAIELGTRSNGAFDVTVGPLVNLWGFGPTKIDSAPDDEAVDRTRQAVGLDKLELRADPPAVRKQVAGLEVDLSAIAKGYGVDEVGRLLEAHQVGNYLVEIGGEVRARGKRPDGSSWRIGIEAPVEGRRELALAVALDDAAMATSGDYRNFREQIGRRWSHTLDPRTARPVEHTLTSVSVVTPECMEADGLATLLMVLGPAEGYDWAVDQQLAALLMVREGDKLVERPTPAFRRLLDE